MTGRVIGNSICVDIFPDIKNAMYFITQPVFTPPLPIYVDQIYTSLYNCKILQTKFQVSSDRVCSLPTNQKYLIQDKLKKLNFHVTLIDANQTPGAVIIILEGEDIGNVLYTGKFCYSEKVVSTLKMSLKDKKVDYMFATDVCKNCKQHSKTKDEATEEVINIIKKNSNKRTIIFEPYFREDILTCLSDKLKNPISVSENMMNHLEEQGRGADFTLNTFSSNVHITNRLSDNRSEENTKNVYKIVLIPCPMKTPEETDQKIQKLKKKGYHVIMYRNHCSQPQLKRLVNRINPDRVVLLNPCGKVAEPSSKKKNIHYWSSMQFLTVVQSRFDSLHNFCKQEISRKAVDDKKLPNNIQNKNCQVMSTKGNFQTSSEPSPPHSFILLESDEDSRSSEKTEINLAISKSFQW